MWPPLQDALNDAGCPTLDEIEAAIHRLMNTHHVMAKGADAAPLAAALGGHAKGKAVCVISGGNIDPAVLCWLLHLTKLPYLRNMRSHILTLR